MVVEYRTQVTTSTRTSVLTSVHSSMDLLIHLTVVRFVGNTMVIKFESVYYAYEEARVLSYRISRTSLHRDRPMHMTCTTRHRLPACLPACLRQPDSRVAGSRTFLETVASRSRGN